MNVAFNQTILLVEDSEDDVFAMQRALRLSDITNPLRVVTDGQQALDYLAAAAAQSDPHRDPLPFIVFLDLKLPYVHGFEVLTWIRKQSAFASTIVIVLTGSAESRDRQKAYELGARSYMIKPPTPEALNHVFASLGTFWLSTGQGSPVMRGALRATGH